MGFAHCWWPYSDLKFKWSSFKIKTSVNIMAHNAFKRLKRQKHRHYCCISSQSHYTALKKASRRPEALGWFFSHIICRYLYYGFAQCFDFLRLFVAFFFTNFFECKQIEISSGKKIITSNWLLTIFQWLCLSDIGTLCSPFLFLGFSCA